MQVTQNLRNWSGDEITLTIDDDKRTFEMYDYQFYLSEPNEFGTVFLHGTTWAEPLTSFRAEGNDSLELAFRKAIVWIANNV